MSERIPRWDNDVRFLGVGTAAWAVPSLAELERMAVKAGWVAEAPETHLAQHLRPAVDSAGFAWLADRIEADGTYAVTLGFPSGSKRAVRRKVWEILGSVAESTSHVVERPAPEGTIFEMVTGQPDGEFASHGHGLRLLVTEVE